MNEDECIWHASYRSKGTTFEGVLNSKKPEEHPLYKCTICSPTYYKECEGYKPLKELSIYKVE